MDSIYLFLALILSLVIIALVTIIFSKLIRELTKLHYEEKEDLFIKLASKSLSEAEFYKKEYPMEVKEKEQVLVDQRKNHPSPEQEKKEKAASRL